MTVSILKWNILYTFSNEKILKWAFLRVGLYDVIIIFAVRSIEYAFGCRNVIIDGSLFHVGYVFVTVCLRSPALVLSVFFFAAKLGHFISLIFFFMQQTYNLKSENRKKKVLLSGFVVKKSTKLFFYGIFIHIVATAKQRVCCHKSGECGDKDHFDWTTLIYTS